MSERQPWTDEELAELEREDTWTDEGSWVVHPTEPAMAQVAARFSSDDFAVIARAARARGMTVTAYVQMAAMEQTSRDRQATSV